MIIIIQQCKALMWIAVEQCKALTWIAAQCKALMWIAAILLKPHIILLGTPGFKYILCLIRYPNPRVHNIIYFKQCNALMWIAATGTYSFP